MKISLFEILSYLRNFFPVESWYVYGEEIHGGEINLPFIPNGGFFIVENSKWNNGLHKKGEAGLTGATFSGEVTAINPPAEVLAIWEEINTWQEKNREAVESPYQSESFGGYSYSKASGNTSSGGSVSWKTVFSERLKPWRKI